MSLIKELLEATLERGESSSFSRVVSLEKNQERNPKDGKKAKTFSYITQINLNLKGGK